VEEKRCYHTPKCNTYCKIDSEEETHYQSNEGLVRDLNQALTNIKLEENEKWESKEILDNVVMR
jgi:hypothetical protein